MYITNIKTLNYAKISKYQNNYCDIILKYSYYIYLNKLKLIEFSRTQN